MRFKAQTNNGSGQPRNLGLYLGWGLLTAWGLLGMQVFAGAGGELPGAGIVGPLSNVAAFAAVLLMCRKPGQRPLMRMTGVPASIAATAVSLGTLAVFLAPGSWTAIRLALIAASSVGYAFLMVGWMSVYGRLDPQDIERSTILSMLVAAVAFLAGTIAGETPRAALCSALPLLSTWMLVQIMRSRPQDEYLAVPDSPPRSTVPESSKGAELALLCICAAVAIRAFVLAAPGIVLDRIDPLGPSALTTLPGLLLAALLVVHCVVFSRHINLDSAFRIMCPLAICGLFLRSLDGTLVPVVGSSLVLAAQWMLYLYLWIYVAERPSETGLSPEMGIAVLRIPFEAGFFAAGLLGIVLPTLAEPDLIATAFCLAAVLSLSLLIPQVQTPSNSPAAKEAGMPSLESIMEKRRTQFSRRYALSEREAQILPYLERGFSSAAIRNEIGLAKSTVDTYIHRLYEKCGVHSRRELLDLIEHIGGE